VADANSSTAKIIVNSLFAITLYRNININKRAAKLQKKSFDFIFLILKNVKIIG